MDWKERKKDDYLTCTQVALPQYHIGAVERPNMLHHEIIAAGVHYMHPQHWEIAAIIPPDDARARQFVLFLAQALLRRFSLLK